LFQFEQLPALALGRRFRDARSIILERDPPIPRSLI